MAELDGRETAASVEGSIGPDGVPVIAVSGELDISNVESVGAIIDGLLDGHRGHAVFIVNGLTFMDSSGIALFVQIHNRLGSIELRDPTDIVRRVIDITGLSETFGVTP
ncbi:MAG TPA: STAS domain-containing protein [Acidimicrobiales bacterium]|jgi:anti-anti-sigma factor|nr:STAS domain-containing protein [Acidimicrobiales bacterium]